MENEEWRDVVGYEGLYRVSDRGRVFSVKNNRVLKPGVFGNSYLNVALYKDTKRKTKRIHSLVAHSFLDSDYLANGLVVNHINFDKQNNNLYNLEIITQRENVSKRNILGSSKYTGVCRIRDKWRAAIVLNKKSICLGLFMSEIEASRCYQSALLCVKEGRVQDIIGNIRSTKGYYFYKRTNKWKAQIWLFGKLKHLGYFNTEEEAKEVFLQASKVES